MAHYWLIVSLSWVSSVSLQYISSSYPDNLTTAEIDKNSLEYALNPQYKENNLISERMISDKDRYQKREPTVLDLLFSQALLSPTLRVRRTPEVAENYPDSDDGTFVEHSYVGSVPRIVRSYGKYNADENNASDTLELKKRSFSPWGGKRDGKSNTWTWKRASMREPSMPKRVRFSPWGGKRSSQIIFKPGSKALKILFSKSVPDLTRIISSYTPTAGGGSSFNVARFRVIPGKDKQNPNTILALANLNDRTSKDSLPFNAFIESKKIIKRDHTDADGNLRKDDKRKVKFSAWGGKRAPPIIGPIWIPAVQTIQDDTLNKILSIRKEQRENQNMMKAL